MGHAFQVSTFTNSCKSNLKMNDCIPYNTLKLVEITLHNSVFCGIRPTERKLLVVGFENRTRLYQFILPKPVETHENCFFSATRCKKVMHKLMKLTLCSY